MENWNKTVAAAQKVLGDKAKVPPMPTALTDGLDKGRAVSADVSSALGEMQDKLIALQKSVGDVVRVAQQYQSTIAKETFGLDPKNTDDSKKIQKARALLDGYMSKATKHTSDSLVPIAKFENAVGAFAKEVG